MRQFVLVMSAMLGTGLILLAALAYRLGIDHLDPGRSEDLAHFLAAPQVGRERRIRNTQTA